MLRAPIATVRCVSTGWNRHGRSRATLASNRTLTDSPATGRTIAAAIGSARIVVPSKPVTWQKMR